MNQTCCFCLHWIVIGFIIALNFDDALLVPSSTAFTIPLTNGRLGRRLLRSTSSSSINYRKALHTSRTRAIKRTTTTTTTTTTRIHGQTDFNIDKNIEIASTSICGSDPNVATKVNQDACFVRQLKVSSTTTYCPNPNVYIAGVLDGHGKKGHVLNAFLRERLPQVLEEKLSGYFVEKEQETENAEDFQLPSETKEDIELMLVEAFEQVNEEARLNTTVPAGRSGTTCVVCIFDAKYGIIYTANVGDSRAIISFSVLLSKEEEAEEINGSSGSNPWHIQALSEETTTKRESERKRIEAGEGRIDSGGNVWYGPVAVAMTRSLGNVVMRRAGIIPTPEVTIFNIPSTMEIKLKSKSELAVSTSKSALKQKKEAVPCYIILGTDGIFDVLKNDDVVDIVDTEFEKTGKLQSSSDNLVAKARDRWQAGLSLDVRIDDATCVLIRFVASL